MYFVKSDHGCRVLRGQRRVGSWELELGLENMEHCLVLVDIPEPTRNTPLYTAVTTISENLQTAEQLRVGVEESEKCDAVCSDGAEPRLPSNRSRQRGGAFVSLLYPWTAILSLSMVTDNRLRLSYGRSGVRYFFHWPYSHSAAFSCVAVNCHETPGWCYRSTANTT